MVVAKEAETAAVMAEAGMVVVAMADCWVVAMAEVAMAVEATAVVGWVVETKGEMEEVGLEVRTVRRVERIAL